jgi:Rieske 2Fe-2S family protein
MVDPLGYSDADLRRTGAASFADLYTDAAVLAVERARLFGTSWALITTSDRLSNLGSYVAASVGGIPLVAVRDRDGQLRAFHNVCRHRGMTLLEGSGVLGRHVTCGYHQWSYTLDGSLVRVPQMDEQFPDMDRCTLGLHAARVEEWHGMVFVNPSADAPDLSTSMAGLDRRLDSFLSGPLHEVAVVEYEAACNWKLLVENHIDVYHLWYLHARSLAAYDHRSFTWESLGDNWWSLEPLKAPHPVPQSGWFDWLGDDMRHRIGAYLVFPNLMLVTTDSYFASYDASPIAPDRTMLTLRVRAQAGADAEALVQSIRAFMAEDVKACEQMQRGVASPHFGIGEMATTHELPIRRFHQSLRQRMSS